MHENPYALPEAKIYTDPDSYQPRTVFGKVTPRTAATLGACAGVGAPVAAMAWAAGIPAEVVAWCALAVAVPVGAVGMGRLRGLAFEQFAPIMLSHWSLPPATRWEPQTWVEPAPPERKLSRYERRAERARERELERVRASERELCDPDGFKAALRV